ncbi:hypothetical protein [Hyalangium gracile]|uniref:hypothetical protein n=1 Tax=Hyalangium gracile TaxID=394092 RepID=UPI001CCE0C70|nr:hypothetical protein [Hyalangium gracile]
MGLDASFQISEVGPWDLGVPHVPPALAEEELDLREVLLLEIAEELHQARMLTKGREISHVTFTRSAHLILYSV